MAADASPVLYGEKFALMCLSGSHWTDSKESGFVGLQLRNSYYVKATTDLPIHVTSLVGRRQLWRPRRAPAARAPAFRRPDPAGCRGWLGGPRASGCRARAPSGSATS